MKNTSFITTVVAALAVAMSSAFAQVNPWETLEGSISLRGLGTETAPGGNGVIAFSDVKVSAKLGAQASGAQVVGPASGASVNVDGSTEKLAKFTNKEILEACVGLRLISDSRGKKIRWASVDGLPVLQIYDKSGAIAEIPASLLIADIGWAANYVGTYGGSATLTATSTASGTSVYVEEGKLSGLTIVEGEALGYLGFFGVGKYTSDERKQLTAKARIAGIGDATPTP